MNRRASKPKCNSLNLTISLHRGLRKSAWQKTTWAYHIEASAFPSSRGPVPTGAMTALGQKATCRDRGQMSALPSKADDPRFMSTRPSSSSAVVVTSHPLGPHSSAASRARGNLASRRADTKLVLRSAFSVKSSRRAHIVFNQTDVLAKIEAENYAAPLYQDIWHSEFIRWAA